MDRYPPTKKARLSPAANAKVDEFGWGDDIDVDEDFIQSIESQYSQHPMCNERPSPNAAPGNALSQNGAGLCPPTDNDHLFYQLQTKIGEVKNLRNEKKDYENKIIEKDKIIRDLQKQLKGKDTEIQMLNLSSKSKFNLNTTATVERSQNQNNRHPRFSFPDVKRNFEEKKEDKKVFDIVKKVSQGDILYSFLESVLTCNDTSIPPAPTSHDITASFEEPCQPDLVLDENEFITNLTSPLLQLCWCSSFEEARAYELIILILKSCYELLNRVQQFLSREPITDMWKSKTIFLDRLKDTTKPEESRDLLQHARLFPTEKGIAARQTITAIAKMIEVHPSMAEIIIESERLKASRWSCINYNPVGSVTNDAAELPTSKSDSDSSERMEVDSSSGSWKSSFVFDVILLTYDITNEITKRNSSTEYEGFLSSVLHLYTIICSRDMNLIYQRQESLIIETIKKILFSLPSFNIIRNIVEFLSASARFPFSGSLCRRSAAETFSENFGCFNFTTDTCMLQVLCVYIEMMRKTPRFVCNYASWIQSSISELHKTPWVRNENDSTKCECLQILEQITIKVVLQAIEQYTDRYVSSSSKSLLRSALSRCVSIFQLFRYKDRDFDKNICPCSGEYRVMLLSLRDIMDDLKTRNFVDHETLRFDDDQREELSIERREEQLVKSLLDSCND